MSNSIVAAPGHHLEDLTTRVKPRTASNILLWGIVAFFVIAAAWATLTELDRTVHAAGRIVPGSRLQVISNLEGGIVGQILVKQGDLVKKGQPLIRLQGTQARAELSSGEVTALALKAKVARLEAEVMGRAPVYPASGGNAALEEQIGIERSLHTSRMRELASVTAAAEARLTQARRAVTEAQATLESRQAARRAYEQQLSLIRPLVERGIEPRLSLVQLENNISIATSDAAAASAAVARAQGGVTEAISALAQARQTWRAQAATELSAAQAEYAARSSVLPALEDRAARTLVVAPMDGRINRVLVSTVGGSVAAGAPLVELVPSEDSLQVEAVVNPKDIGFVRMGQPAKINVSAYDAAIYGSLDGEVVTISPDATVDERTGESHYMVKVRTNGSALTDPDGRRLPLGSGMTVDVSLLGDKRTVLSYLFSPITRLSERALRE
jgi:membrane fusion protein, adhesin transport system